MGIHSKRCQTSPLMPTVKSEEQVHYAESMTWTYDQVSWIYDQLFEGTCIKNK